MQANDAAEQISAALEEERTRRDEEDQFRTRAALIIAVLAMLLAIASVGGDNANADAINANIKASDTWAFFQAKNIRQTDNTLTAAQLEAALILHGELTADARPAIQGSIDRFRATAARYEDEPDPSDPENLLKGEGKRQLMAQARDWETRRDESLKQDANFDYATALFQIGIVLGSVAIVSLSRVVLTVAVGLGLVASALAVNGFLLIVDLPIG